VQQSQGQSPVGEANPVPEVRMAQTLTIERTAKQYKFGMVIGLLMMAFGVGATLYSVNGFFENYERLPRTFAELAEDQKAVYVSLPGIALGLVVYYFERFLAWWNNG